MEVFKIKSHESVHCDFYFMSQEMLNAKHLAVIQTVLD